MADGATLSDLSWIWIYPCVDIRLQPSSGYIHGYCAVAFAN